VTVQFLTYLILIAGGVLALATGYQLLLLVAAALPRRRPAAVPNSGRLSFLVLVPAHDEELTIEPTLAALRGLDYPKERFEVIVIADNCRDGTAELARACGATVLERTNPSQRGKGYALAWALQELRRERPNAEAFAFVDADCVASPNLLTAIESRLRAGAEAVQVNDVVANPRASWSSALRYAAFTLINTVAPLGKDRLGISCGLRGTGMGFSATLLTRVPWESFSLAEDGEYHIRVVLAGGRVAFAPEASVASAMPTRLSDAWNQHLRWEGGKWQLIRRWTPRLLVAALRHRNPAGAVVALEPLIPPQSLQIGGTCTLTVLAALSDSQVAMAFGAAVLVAQFAYILGGLALVGAPVEVYRALLLAPMLMVWKVRLYLRILSGRGPRAWVRTGRVH
jgi:cellulose synthase/poly-beta-1,6-N-acetylglucosamine synthase-like glycosyltransferase